MARTCFVCVLWTGGLTAGPVLAQGNTWLWETELLVYFYTMSSRQWAAEPHLHLQRRCREEGIGMGEGKGSIFSIYAWTGHEQLLLCTWVPQRLHHSPLSAFRANEDCGFWDLEGIAMGRSAVARSQHSLLSVPLHSRKMGINSISLCQGSVSRTETIKV